MVTKTIRSRIALLSKNRNSPDGNPSWSIGLDDGREFRTKPDANFAFQLDYSWLGRQVLLTVKSGFVQDIEDVAEADAMHEVRREKLRRRRDEFDSNWSRREGGN